VLEQQVLGHDILPFRFATLVGRSPLGRNRHDILDIRRRTFSPVVGLFSVGRFLTDLFRLIVSFNQLRRP
jgi:hypothetical protein